MKSRCICTRYETSLMFSLFRINKYFSTVYEYYIFISFPCACIALFRFSKIADPNFATSSISPDFKTLTWPIRLLHYDWTDADSLDQSSGLTRTYNFLLRFVCETKKQLLFHSLKKNHCKLWFNDLYPLVLFLLLSQ